MNVCMNVDTFTNPICCMRLYQIVQKRTQEFKKPVRSPCETASAYPPFRTKLWSNLNGGHFTLALLNVMVY